MSKYFNKFFVRVLLLSAFLTIVLNIGDNLINANGVTDNSVISSINKDNFKKVSNISVGRIGIAITTNIGTRFKQRKEIPATIYKDIFSVNDVISNQDNVNLEIIGANMSAIEEYRNILKTNVKQLLDTSYDKPRILNAFIEQLEYRYVLGNTNMTKLNKQQNVFKADMAAANNEIELLKQKIELDFRNNNSKASLENINKYLEYKEQYFYSKTYYTYVNHFLYEYKYLGNYNKKLLDTLILNKDILVKDSFVVIPDSGTELLRNFDLIYTENEFKQ